MQSYLIVVYRVVNGKPDPAPINAVVVDAPEPPKFVNQDGNEFENLVAPEKFDA